MTNTTMNTGAARSNTKTVPLSGGKVALIDEDDFGIVSPYKWYLTEKGYAGSTKVVDRKTLNLRMHRMIMGLCKGDKREVDHINGNKLDNRRQNLRICTRRENNFNMPLQSSNKSGYKGVHQHKRDGKWEAMISVGGKRYWLGRFNTAEEAYAKYCEAAPRLHGEFANLGKQNSGDRP